MKVEKTLEVRLIGYEKKNIKKKNNLFLVYCSFPVCLITKNSLCEGKKLASPVAFAGRSFAEQTDKISSVQQSTELGKLERSQMSDLF